MSRPDRSIALRPVLHGGIHVFAQLAAGTELSRLDGIDVVATMREAEGLTVVLRQEDADRLGLDGRFPCAWITLAATTELDAVGVTARFAAALAGEGIACNVIAGAHHDHLFVPHGRREEAVRLLSALRW